MILGFGDAWWNKGLATLRSDYSIDYIHSAYWVFSYQVVPSLLCSDAFSVSPIQEPEGGFWRNGKLPGRTRFSLNFFLQWLVFILFHCLYFLLSKVVGYEWKMGDVWYRLLTLDGQIRATITMWPPHSQISHGHNHKESWEPSKDFFVEAVAMSNLFESYWFALKKLVTRCLDIVVSPRGIFQLFLRNPITDSRRQEPNYPTPQSINLYSDGAIISPVLRARDTWILTVSPRLVSSTKEKEEGSGKVHHNALSNKMSASGFQKPT
jgi:hypothetical protein